jgi:hypothetical protein
VIGRARLDDSTDLDATFIFGIGSDRLGGLAIDSQDIYWAQGTKIGRANLDGTDIDDGYIAGAGDPLYIAVDSFPHATSPAVTCAPSLLTPQEPTGCAATVTDPAPDGVAPTGTVTFTSSAPGAFSPSTTCTLVAVFSGTSACTVAFAPSADGNAAITAAFSGEVRHATSSASTVLVVRSTPTMATQPLSLSNTTPILSHLTVDPRTASSAGRLVGGRCVRPTSTNRTKRRCRRPVSLHLRYRLTIAASVRLDVEQVRSGTLVSGRCVPSTRANRRRPRCTHLVATGASKTYASVAGENQLTLNGHFGERPLGPAPTASLSPQRPRA